MYGRLRRVVVRRPDRTFGSADPGVWNYTARPDLDAALEEHARFVALLADFGAEVIRHEGPELGADAIFVHDAALVTDAGTILLRMGKTLRRREPGAIERLLERLGEPVLGRLDGDATAEAGDLLWLDAVTLAVGQGFRTNAAGAAQLGRLLADFGVHLEPVPLPYHRGPDGCLHLMSLISMLDRDLAVTYSPLLPVSFIRALEARGIHRVEVPAEEFATMGPNVLALAPRRCLMLEGNPVTRSRLEAAGCSVATYRGTEISLKAEGGPTCLTRPLLRDSEYSAGSPTR
jgi:dimethylargininase